MYRRPLRVLTICLVVTLAACASNPENEIAGHEAAMKTHQALARDMENAGNDAMARYHREKAEHEYEQIEQEECGLLCSLFDVLLDTKQDSRSSKSCRDPITNSPIGPPRC